MKVSDFEGFLASLPEPESYSDKHLYIWGTGNTARLYQEGFAREKNYDVYGYTSSNITDGGGGIFNHRLFTPKEAASDPKALALICTPTVTTCNEISAFLDSLNIKHCHIDTIIFGQHKDELHNVIDILDDERSRDIYLHLLKCRTECNYADAEYTSFDTYCANPAFQILNLNDIVIDCGAFVGDTIEKFIWQHEGHLKKIIGFEPDTQNFAAMAKRVARLREEWNFSTEAISIYPYGVSDKSSVSYIHRDTNRSTGSSVTSEAGNGTEEIQTVALDDFLDEEKVTFIKADIESYEYRMLKGAEKIIKQYRPRLGVCIYHNATDFYSLPLLVKELCPEYKLMIRHHTLEIGDTVLYAW